MKDIILDNLGELQPIIWKALRAWLRFHWGRRNSQWCGLQRQHLPEGPVCSADFDLSAPYSSKPTPWFLSLLLSLRNLTDTSAYKCFFSDNEYFFSKFFQFHLWSLLHRKSNNLSRKKKVCFFFVPIRRNTELTYANIFSLYLPTARQNVCYVLPKQDDNHSKRNRRVYFTQTLLKCIYCAPTANFFLQ